MIKHSHFSLILDSIMFSSRSNIIQTKKVSERDKISSEFKWRIDHIYATYNDWEKDFQKVKNLLIEIKKYKGNFTKTPTNLINCLILNDEIDKIIRKLYPFARLQQDENTTNNKYQALTGKVQTLLTEVCATISFIEPEIIKLSKNTMKSFCKIETELKKYNFYFNNLQKYKKHILSHKEEIILSRTMQITAAPHNIFEMLSNADIHFPIIKDEIGNKIQLSEGRYSIFVRSHDRRMRKQAFNGLMNTYNQYRNTFAATLNSNVQNNIFYSKIRKYDSPLQAALQPNNIPEKIYDNLISTINNNIESFHRYVRLKKKILGINKMHIYDMYASVDNGETIINIKYPEALDLVRKALEPLGPEYIAKYNESITNGWIDVYENKGKHNGAYSWGVYGVHPYILLNYNNQYSDVSTLAHEMGHAMHSYYSNLKQPFPTADYTIFTAETASTVNEILLIDYMLKNTNNKNIKRYLINQYLECISKTVYRQTMFAEFEKLIYEQSIKNEILTADILGNIYHNLNKKYFGPDMIIDKLIDIEWARIPHFFRNFYVYQYATGYSAAIIIVDRLKRLGSTAQESYIHNFLEAGGSDTPINILKNTGVDISKPQTIKFTIEKFNSLLNEYEELI